MTKVNCYLEECVHNKDMVCTKDEILLDSEHYCMGGRFRKKRKTMTK